MAIAHRSSPYTLLPEIPLTPCFIPIRYRPGNLGTWSGHLQFANDLIAALQPSLIVELGTHWGESYFTFCQSVFQNGIDCLCYSVDHWLGDPHAGHYGEEVYQDVQSFNEKYYRGFSYLLRMSFDDALSQFADDSIDLLHIDGLHTFEAASHDFRTWLPKVRPGGFVLIHDIAVKHADFGVWRLWDELRIEFSETFTFHHWWGLGVLRKPGGNRIDAPIFDLLFDSPRSSEQLRRYYLISTAYLENTHAAIPIQPTVPGAPAIHEESPVKDSGVRLQVFLFQKSGYSEQNSLIQDLEIGKWEEFAFALPAGTGGGPLRIDLSDCVSVVQIRRLALLDESAGTLLFEATDFDDFRDVHLSDSAVLLRDADHSAILSYTNDPYLILPDTASSEGRLRLEISIKIQTDVTAVAGAANSARREALRMARQEAAEKIHALETELNASTAKIVQTQEKIGQLERLESELNTSAAQIVHAQQQIERLESMVKSSDREVRMLQALFDAAEDSARAAEQRAKTEVLNSTVLSDKERETQQTKEWLEMERNLRLAMLNSNSWKLTKPLRTLMEFFKR